MDAVVAGCGALETGETPSAFNSVGWGKSPDETSETTLDAMIMDA